jgi:uncharacterized protein YqfB (UPF0267 family)
VTGAHNTFWNVFCGLYIYRKDFNSTSSSMNWRTQLLLLIKSGLEANESSKKRTTNVSSTSVSSFILEKMNNVHWKTKSITLNDLKHSAQYYPNTCTICSISLEVKKHLLSQAIWIVALKMLFIGCDKWLNWLRQKFETLRSIQTNFWCATNDFVFRCWKEVFFLFWIRYINLESFELKTPTQVFNFFFGVLIILKICDKNHQKWYIFYLQVQFKVELAKRESRFSIVDSEDSSNIWNHFCEPFLKI